MKLQRAIICAGMIGTGKTTHATFIASKLQIPRVSFGGLVKQEAQARGLQTGRRTYQDLGHELFHNLGAEQLLTAAIEHANIRDCADLIVDGVRHPTVHQAICAITYQTYMLYFTAPEDVRFQRYNDSYGETDFAVFQQINNHPIERGIALLEPLADLIVSTDAPLLVTQAQLTKYLLPT